MTLADYYDRQIPEYYPTMHLDGYTPNEILHAARRKMYQNIQDRMEETQLPAVQIQSVVKIK